MFVSYFKVIFNSNNNCVDIGLVEDLISHHVDNSMNFLFTNFPSFEEVKNVVFGMNSNNASGLDGFGTYFFRNC